MKTQKSLSTKMENAFAMLPLILPIIITIFCLASCKKEEPVTPLNNSEFSHSGTRKAGDYVADGLPVNTNPLASTWDLAKIEHHGGRSLLPTYTVTIKSDGLVIYEGMHNVYKSGTIGFRISADLLANIKFLFYSSHFAQIRDTLVPNVDAPVNLTFYRENTEVVGQTLIDVNDGYPQMVIQIRQKIEGWLKISDLVKGPVTSFMTTKKVVD